MPNSFIIWTILVVSTEITFASGLSVVEDGSDQQAIQGTWKVVSSKYDGKDAGVFIGSEVSFDGKFMISKTKDKTVKDMYKIDASLTPKQINITGNRSDGVLKIPGIYSLKGDSLTLCHSDPGKPRPTEFVTKQGDKRSLVILKRIKKKRIASLISGQ